jgi:hypothetical protein
MVKYLDDGTPIINIGEGDLNSDWIKHVDHGRHQLRDLMAHEEIMIVYWEREGMPK